FRALAKVSRLPAHLVEQLLNALCLGEYHAEAVSELRPFGLVLAALLRELAQSRLFAIQDLQVLSEDVDLLARKHQSKCILRNASPLYRAIYRVVRLAHQILHKWLAQVFRRHGIAKFARSRRSCLSLGQQPPEQHEVRTFMPGLRGTQRCCKRGDGVAM